jgi:hypothetical protein
MTTPVTITYNDLRSARPDGSVIILTGTGPEGQRVTFAADRRPAQDLVSAILESGEETAEVEGWQILGGAA